VNLGHDFVEGYHKLVWPFALALAVWKLRRVSIDVLYVSLSLVGVCRAVLLIHSMVRCVFLSSTDAGVFSSLPSLLF